MKASVSSLIGINGCHDVFMTDLHAAKKHISNWEKMNTKVSQGFFGNKAHSIAQWINEHCIIEVNTMRQEHTA